MEPRTPPRLDRERLAGRRIAHAHEHLADVPSPRYVAEPVRDGVMPEHGARQRLHHAAREPVAHHRYELVALGALVFYEVIESHTVERDVLEEHPHPDLRVAGHVVFADLDEA